MKQLKNRYTVMNVNLLKLTNVIEGCNKHLIRIFSAYKD